MFQDWTSSEILQIVTVGSTIVTSVIGFLTIRAVRTVHVIMNSRMTQLLAGATAQGANQERKEADQRALALELTEVAKGVAATEEARVENRIK